MPRPDRVRPSAGGGLPEAIGPCGLTFPNGSGDALAHALDELLSRRRERLLQLLQPAESHLSKHAPQTVARRYVEVFARTAGNSAAS